MTAAGPGALRLPARAGAVAVGVAVDGVLAVAPAAAWITLGISTAAMATTARPRTISTLRRLSGRWDSLIRRIPSGVSSYSAVPPHYAKSVKLRGMRVNARI